VRDDFGPVDLKCSESLVGIKRREMLVPARLDKLDDAEPMRELVGPSVVE